MRDILSENSKKDYPKSVTELLQGVCYSINNIPIFME
jgi:hypothetical protein